MGVKRRIDVMLSSTFFDLKHHRGAVIAAMNGLQLTPLAQEFDASLPDSDLIKASLEKVDAADVYVGLIGSRYGQRPECIHRNPERLSLTELEYRRAVERKLPRLMFIMADDHEMTLADLKLGRAEGDEGRRLHEAFIQLARSDRIAAEFSSSADLETKANKSFFALQRSLLEPEVPAPVPVQELPPSPDDKLPATPPAFDYVRKPYLERQRFAGRVTELAQIDQWAMGPEAMLLFQGIGGMGKSMLTWHWLKTRAGNVRKDWAGRLWYSFYEQGADLNDFCVRALAYIRHEPPSAFRNRRTIDLGEELRRELDARPWLLILDGLERVLVAYNRAGKEHMPDDEAVVVRDGMGLDREPRDCFRPEDDDVLATLAQATQSKLLASSRLTPSALTNEARQPIPGVMRVALEGLAPEDAELVLRNAGVRGNGWQMRRYLEHNFAGHPLSVGIVAGQVMTFLEVRGDFDRWVENPQGGADPALIAKDLRGRQNHILEQAFDNLDDEQKTLLGSIAMASIALTLDVLCVLNPKCPIEPKKIEPPEEWTEQEFYLRTSDADIDKAYGAWQRAASPEEIAAAKSKLDALRDKNFAERNQLYDANLKARAAWQHEAAVANAWLMHALPHLETRGLLQYDVEHASLDMHPAIRHTVLASLSPEARNSTGSHVSDALSSRPIKPFEEARSLDDLALVIARVEALNAAGKFEDSWKLFSDGGLKVAVKNLHYTYQGLELLQRYFIHGWTKPPSPIPEKYHADVLYDTAGFLYEEGRPGLASELMLQHIRITLSNNNEVTPGALGTLAMSLKDNRQCALAERARSLAIRLSEAGDDMEEVLWVKTNEAANHVDRGRLDEASAIISYLKSLVESGEVNASNEAHILTTELYALLVSSQLSDDVAASSLNRIRVTRRRRAEIWSLALIARSRQANGDHASALDAFGDLIALANETGWSELPKYEARRGLSLAILGRQEEARRIATKSDSGKAPPHADLAPLYLELGDPGKALLHVLAGFERAWGEGPPHHEHWDLEDCRKVLAALGEPEPVLPLFDPANVEPFDFEPEIERLIAQKLADRAKSAERKAARPGPTRH